MVSFSTRGRGQVQWRGRNSWRVDSHEQSQIGNRLAHRLTIAKRVARHVHRRKQSLVCDVLATHQPPSAFGNLASLLELNAEPTVEETPAQEEVLWTEVEKKAEK